MSARFKSRLLRLLAAAAALLPLLTATGCLYPQERTPGAGYSNTREAEAVQDAVDRYYERTGTLPIRNAADRTPEYEKFKLDFAKLSRMGYLAQIPAAAFESGGSYQFLIIDEQTKPAVKLLDLAAFQAVAGVQKKVDEYRTKQGGANPAGAALYPGFGLVDFGAIGMRDPQVRSMFTGQTLTLMLDAQGVVYADYGADIVRALADAADGGAPEGDLRRVLIDSTVYVPVRSPVYRLTNGEPEAVAAEPAAQ